MTNDTAIIIPAFQPDRTLLKLIDSIFDIYSREDTFGMTVIIIDDGSTTKVSKEVFQKLSNYQNVIILKHTKNKGKGAALKTGIEYAKQHKFEIVITSDADGQHLAWDIKRVGDHAKKTNSFTMGTRKFGKDVPFRSRFGNTLTSFLFRITFRSDLSDTQSGLRAFPASFYDILLAVDYDRYEYEFETLITIARIGEISKVPITTVYEEGNPSSHFHPIIDSGRIYLVFLRYAVITPIIALLDFGGFKLLSTSFDEPTSFVLVRIVTVILYFMAMRKIVFKYSKNIILNSLSFIVLVLVNLAIASQIYKIIDEIFSLQPFAAYLISSVPLFFLNFIIQRNYIFRR